MLNEEWVRAVAATVADAQERSYAEEVRKARETVEHLDANDADEARKAADANDGGVLTPWRATIATDDAAREAIIADWALDEMVATAMRLGVPFGRSLLPDPRTLLSFYLVKVVHVTRILGVILEGRSPTSTDVYDLTALQDAACYADVFVTTDRKLLNLAARVPLPIRIINFTTWNNELAAMLARAVP